MEMDIDSVTETRDTSHSLTESSELSVSDVAKAKAALYVLEEGLRPFVHDSVRAALGEDMYSLYLPSEDLTCAGLLRYIRQKWLGVFCDTALQSHSSVVDRLAKSADIVQKARNDSKLEETKNVFEDVQAILIAIRKHALAAKAARISAQGKIESRSEPASTGRFSDDSDLLLHASANTGQQTDLRPKTPILFTSNFESPPQSNAAEVVTQSGSNFSNMPVALDGSNIAWRHGNSKRFSYRGIVEALLYFAGRGHPSVVFLPEGRICGVQIDDLGEYDGEGEAFQALKSLEGSPQLVLTPERDYDDSYLTHFAREHQAVVVSNDSFADQIYQAQAESAEAADEWRRWLAACRLSFTFHGHAFVRNPYFSFGRASDIAAKLRKSFSTTSLTP